jgi:hypothetical protein
MVLFGTLDRVVLALNAGLRAKIFTRLVIVLRSVVVEAGSLTVLLDLSNRALDVLASIVERAVRTFTLLDSVLDG